MHTVSALVGVLGVLLLSCRASAADYSDDDLCRAIGQTPVIALQPRDRLFMEQKCACYEGGCAAIGSPRASAFEKQQQAETARLKREKAEADRQLAESKKQSAARVGAARAKHDAAVAQTNPLRKAYWDCTYEPASPGCRDQLVALQEACEATGQFKDKDGSFDLELCSRESAADTKKRQAAAKAARDALFDQGVVPARKVYWACVKDRQDCGPEFSALKDACERFGEFKDRNGNLQIGAYQGDRP